MTLPGDPHLPPGCSNRDIDPGPVVEDSYRGTGHDAVALYDAWRQRETELDLEYNAALWEAEHGPRKD